MEDAANLKDKIQAKIYVDLLNRQKGIQKKAKKFKGRKPAESLRRPRRQLENDFMELAQQMQREEMTQSTTKQPTVRRTFIGEAYPPCKQPLENLRLISLRELFLETQHRRRLLIVRTFSVPVYMASIQCAIEDPFGDVDRLAIYNLLPTVAPDEILPQGAIVAIKEPYYKHTNDGGLIVRVDHPSDLVLLEPGNPLIPPAFASQEVAKAAPTAIEMKERGNEEFNMGNWRLADAAYSSSIEASRLAKDFELQRSAFRNRAIVRLRLGRYELAKADALAGIEPLGTTSEKAKHATAKAQYLAGRAAYEMGEYEAAKRHFEAVLELDWQDKHAKEELNRTTNRIAEQEEGKYDFVGMFKSASRLHTYLDHASFLKNTKVAPAGRRGRGLFATKDLEPGEVIFVEKAFVATSSNNGRSVSVLINSNTNRVVTGTHAHTFFSAVDKMRWNPKLANRCLDLYDGGTFDKSREVAVIDGQAVVDTFRVQSIAELNGFNYPQIKSGDNEYDLESEDTSMESMGIWLRASYANHSCIPNGWRAFIGDVMIVRAVRPIRAGEEIFLAYTNPAMAALKRQEKLKETYGFDCRCALCKVEVRTHRSLLNLRTRLGWQIDDFLEENPLGASNLQGTRLEQRITAKNLLAEIRATYPPSDYGSLPRPQCTAIGIFDGLAGIGETDEDVAKMLSILRDSGYVVILHYDGVLVDREYALATWEAVHAAIQLSRAFNALGNDIGAAAMQALSREVYTVRVGTDINFDHKFL